MRHNVVVLCVRFELFWRSSNMFWHSRDKAMMTGILLCRFSESYNANEKR